MGLVVLLQVLKMSKLVFLYNVTASICDKLLPIIYLKFILGLTWMTLEILVYEKPLTSIPRSSKPHSSILVTHCFRSPATKW